MEDFTVVVLNTHHSVMSKFQTSMKVHFVGMVKLFHHMERYRKIFSKSWKSSWGAKKTQKLNAPVIFLF